VWGGVLGGLLTQVPTPSQFSRKRPFVSSRVESTASATARPRPIAAKSSIKTLGTLALYALTASGVLVPSSSSYTSGLESLRRSCDARASAAGIDSSPTKPSPVTDEASKTVLSDMIWIDVVEGEDYARRPPELRDLGGGFLTDLRGDGPAAQTLAWHTSPDRRSELGPYTLAGHVMLLARSMGWGYKQSGTRGEKRGQTRGRGSGLIGQ
jgi:hypothetical protein